MVLWGGNVFDGCKAKLITYRALVVYVAFGWVVSHDWSPLVEAFGECIGEFSDDSNFDLCESSDV